MGEYILGALVLAFILSIFDFDEIFIEALKEIFRVHISTASYYFMFFVGGIAAYLIDVVLHKLR